ncbi:branched-chain amino acid ABC transporter permease [Falsibacillus albus]|uniref:Branched-chain amino acid ABC transporter permease n=1 Tax=Falsibacillus albus TaxID=2478915 RepID=A0A3L7K4R7_9BACI|nr:branched-chain amino acid ABC transporter permease [Falsibacillus albus]RLQ97254.1 branched-chain amino acid ABC transporter permease [Falsibacillus albus]
MRRYFQVSTMAMALVGFMLVVLPSIYDSRSFLILMTQIFIFAIFAMSYDILLGFTGIVSFGHAMFFGIGAYSTGVILDRFDHTLPYFFLAILVGSLISTFISFIVGLLTLRLKSHYYAMLTLAFSGLFLVAAEKWRTLTKGNDGFTFRVPDVMIDRTTFYFICLALMLFVYFFLKRITQSPFGKVMLAIRENEQRTESLGFTILHYKVLASILAGVTASLAGSFYVMSLRFVNTSVFSIDTTLDALLMTIIGGVGTLAGPILGAGLIEFAHHWLTELAKEHPIFERWLIFFGILYIVAVMFFPAGIVGTIQKWGRKKQTPSKKQSIEKHKAAG